MRISSVPRLVRGVFAAAALAAGLTVSGPLQAQPGKPALAFAAAAEAETARSLEVVASIPALPALSSTSLPPKPSWKEERLARAEAMYAEGYKLYQSGDAAGARRVFDQAIDLVLANASVPVNHAAFDRRFEELVRKIYRIDVDGQANPSESEPSFDAAPIDDILSLTFPVDPKLKLKVREEVAATVSQLPLEPSDSVLSFINYFSGERGRRTLIAGLRRAGRYKPMISRILDEEGIPQEFIFLAQAESGFLPRAMSYMAAGGMWQFIRETGAKYGLKHDAWVDERFDPEMATRAAARHLRDLYHEFGDWYLAIAAYNCGHGNVERAVTKTGYADVWELRSRGTLPLETSNYVPIILAMTIMSKNPANYGIEDVVPEEPLVWDSVELESLTSLALISDVLGLPVSELKELNPALLRDLAPAGYKLHIPRGTGSTLLSALELVPSEKRAAWRIHRVGAGESLPQIASRFRLSSNAVENVNQALADELATGSYVVIPAAPAPVVTQRASRATKSVSKGKSRYARAKTPARTTVAKTRAKSTVAKKTTVAKSTAKKKPQTAARAKARPQSKSTARAPRRSSARSGA